MAKSGTTNDPLESFYELVTGEDETRVCKDIPESACDAQPRNFFGYLAANLFTKIADELSSARLILPWLLGALGAPAAFIGYLVPVREAGVLLPQVAIAAAIRRLARRKYAWFTGAALSALTLAIMAAVAPTLSGAAAGWAVLGLLALYSVGRGICSVAAKDVLGKTVSKTRRGTAMGYASGIAGVATLVLGLTLWLWPELRPDAGAVAALVGLAAALWLLASLLLLTIAEPAGATEGAASVIDELKRAFGYLRDDPVFRHYLIGRILLMSLALAPPFYVLLAQQSGNGAAGLGLLIVANGLAASVSSPLWGRLSDRSSRWTMTLAAAAGGVISIALAAAVLLGGDAWLNPMISAGLFLLIAICHGGVRLGRKVYLVDLANVDNRASYVAVSNTLIGIAMLAGGAIGLVGDWLGTAWVIGLLGIIALVAAGYCWRIEEVSD